MASRAALATLAAAALAVALGAWFVGRDAHPSAIEATDKVRHENGPTPRVDAHDDLRDPQANTSNAAAAAREPGHVDGAAAGWLPAAISQRCSVGLHCMRAQKP